jgi:hypothetical protein
MNASHQNLGGDVGSLPRYQPLTCLNFGGGSGLASGAGVPPNAFGQDGWYYFRSDTPGTANQRIYVRIAGVWTGVV